MPSEYRQGALNTFWEDILAPFESKNTSEGVSRRTCLPSMVLNAENSMLMVNLPVGQSWRPNGGRGTNRKERRRSTSARTKRRGRGKSRNGATKPLRSSRHERGCEPTSNADHASSKLAWVSCVSRSLACLLAYSSSVYDRG